MGKARCEVSLELLKSLLELPYEIIAVKESKRKGVFEIVISGCDLPLITDGEIPLGQMVLKSIRAEWKPLEWVSSE